MSVVIGIIVFIAAFVFFVILDRNKEAAKRKAEQDKLRAEYEKFERDHRLKSK